MLQRAAGQAARCQPRRSQAAARADAARGRSTTRRSPKAGGRRPARSCGVRPDRSPASSRFDRRPPPGRLHHGHHARRPRRRGRARPSRRPASGSTASSPAAWPTMSPARAPARSARFEDPELEVAGAGLPDRARLLPLLGVDARRCGDDRRPVAGRRCVIRRPPRRSASPRTTCSVVDLVRDGPHGLVAGTTGPGKSELLRTLVAGLAASVDPDHLTFVLDRLQGRQRVRRVRPAAPHGRHRHRPRRAPRRAGAALPRGRAALPRAAAAGRGRQRPRRLPATARVASRCRGSSSSSTSSRPSRPSCPSSSTRSSASPSGAAASACTSCWRRNGRPAR